MLSNFNLQKNVLSKALFWFYELDENIEQFYVLKHPILYLSNNTSITQLSSAKGTSVLTAIISLSKVDKNT